MLLSPYQQTGIFAQHMENNQFICGVLPPSYHKCSIQSETTTIQGCLFKFDNPYEQCSDDRTGKDDNNSIKLQFFFYFEGFMCGKCPPSKGLTLSLNDCLNCQASDVVLFILFCKLTNMLLMAMSRYTIKLWKKQNFLYTSVATYVYNLRRLCTYVSTMRLCWLS